jgi:glucose-1-phosphate thymidylyltransferase
VLRLGDCSPFQSLDESKVERLQAVAVEKMGRGFTWLDTGTPDSLLEAADFVATLEKRQGFRIACPEEVAFNMGYIDRNQLTALGVALGKSDYAAYVRSVASF